MSAVKDGNVKRGIFGKQKQDIRYIPEYCRQKLIRYAESFRELAESIEKEEEEIFAVEAEGEEQDRRRMLEKQGAMENRMLISQNLCQMSKIMTGLAQEILNCRQVEDSVRKVLLHALRTNGIYSENICYMSCKGKEQASIGMTLWSDRRKEYPAQEVAGLLSELLRQNLKLSVTSPCRIDGRPQNFVFTEEPAFYVLTGFCKVKKEDEEVSGDHYAILESEKGSVSLLLSDGTGSGGQASRDSEEVLDLMEKLLEAGYEAEAAANMVNVAFYTKNQDLSHPTLDLCEINIYDGSVMFCKVGAATTFIKRAERVERIAGQTLPLGIFRNIECEKRENISVKDGDYIIMMTDGVLDALADDEFEPEMERILSDIPEICPEEMAGRIIEKTLVFCEGRVRDDMTVLVAEICGNG